MKQNIEYLQMLGLTQYQAKVMVAMFACNGSGLTAGNLCKISEIPITKIYQVLKSLESMQFITCNSGKPKIYHGLKANELMNELIKRKQKFVDNLMTEKKNQLKMIRGLGVQIQKDEKFAKIHPVLASAQN